MTTRPISSPTARASAAANPLRVLWSLLNVAHQRHQLALLDDHLLRDIGLSRAEAMTEAERPLWDAPAHWQR